MKKHALAVAVAAALAFATDAGAQQTQGSKPQTMEAVATVTNVDRVKRTVQVETPRGQTVVTVPAETNLEDIQVGSRYRVRYSEPVALAVERGAQLSAPDPATASVGQTGRGTGEGVRTDKMSGIVEQLDPAGKQIVVRTSEGGKQSFKIADAAAQGLQGSIKSGDAVTVTYQQAVATQLRSTPQPVSDPAPAP